ncbi:MAG: adenylate/guanylate cyclase domain-containing protein [Prochlorothrix sp.]|nr:adenylate/guanylate cyclase domain-containing protein [Prochlorothrix sp.]
MSLALKLFGRRLLFRSIRTRMMVATALLVVSTIGTVVWFWAKSESEAYREQKRNQARLLAIAVSQAMTVELVEQNWSSLRVRMEDLLRENPDFAYIVVSDRRLNHQIVAAIPSDLAEQYIPDLVPLKITQAALSPDQPVKIQETYLLRDVEFPRDLIRARQGEPLLEVAANIMRGDLNHREVVGTFRVGISLREVDQQVADVITKALLIGAAALGVGLVGAYWLAQHLSGPVLRLKASVTKITAGDLQHQADIHAADEIGDLAQSFNEMSLSLQASFSKLQRTLESFERFVPSKFLQAIAPEGIEHIQVGQASHRSIAILFADIRNYTSLSEKLEPIELFRFLNSYLACMGEAIESEGGFIDKYIGDAIMALFDQDSTDGAVRAAIAMQQGLVTFNRDLVAQGFKPIAIGIGIHYGDVVMGTVGFNSHIESTVIGDAVNIAARVEGLTKNYGCYVLITDAVVAALQHPDAFEMSLVDQSVQVRGKNQAIDLYRVHLHFPNPTTSNPSTHHDPPT